MCVAGSPMPAKSTSPASASAPGTRRSIKASLMPLPASDASSRRISAGAAAAPRRYDDAPSNGTPISVGVTTLAKDVLHDEPHVRRALREPAHVPGEPVRAVADQRPHSRAG